MALNEFKEAILAFNNFEKLKLNKTNDLNNKLPMAIYYELKTKYYLYNSKSDSVLSSATVCDGFTLAGLGNIFEKGLTCRLTTKRLVKRLVV